jgi:hypothetical protein
MWGWVVFGLFVVISIKLFHKPVDDDFRWDKW